MPIPITQFLPTLTLPSKIDNKLSPYFAFRLHEVIKHTPRQNIKLAKSIIHHPMWQNQKGWDQMLRRKSLQEVIVTDTYFDSEKYFDGNYFAHVLFGMPSKMLHVARMITKTEFPDV
jgi:hypothetical protein